jgi:hypothetical protein
VFSSESALTPMRRGDGRTTSWVVWAVRVAVSGLIGFTGTHFSVRTLRYVTAGTDDRGSPSAARDTVSHPVGSATGQEQAAEER